MRRDTRGQIIKAADQLFYSNSIRDVSVDRVAERAGVTKKTLYYHFRSKDELVAAYLEARLEPTIERYVSWLGPEGPLPERIEHMFQRLAGAVEGKSWKGCGFTRAAVELADTPGHPALDVARRHKAAFEERLQDELGAAGYEDAAALAKMLMVLVDGAVARMLVHRDPTYALEAGRAARKLLG